MANPAVTYTFVNGNVADAGQVNQNFTDIINALTDGTKSLNIDALTAAGAAILNGAVTLGNAVGDAITVNGAFAGTGGDASATQRGLVTTGAQSWAGVKTFNSGLINGATSSWIELGANSGHGSTNNKIRKLSVLRSSGAAITHTGSSTDGSTLTINETGLYHISYTDAYASAASAFGISRNSNQLTTGIVSITESTVLMYCESSSDIDTNVSVLAYLSANDVLRAHTDGNPNRAAAPRCKVFITQVLKMS